jgi:hypothetical protein
MDTPKELATDAGSAPIVLAVALALGAIACIASGFPVEAHSRRAVAFVNTQLAIMLLCFLVSLVDWLSTGRRRVRGPQPGSWRVGEHLLFALLVPACFGSLFRALPIFSAWDTMVACAVFSSVRGIVLRHRVPQPIDEAA